MKHHKIFGLLALSALIFLTACEKEKTNSNSIEGTYKGTLTNEREDGTENVTVEAVAEITKTDENTIEVHCYNTAFDTTFMLNYYNHYDSAYVCLTGSDFEKMYGHMPGEEHLGGMMHDMHDDETQWMHHINEEHDEGDAHFGGFDRVNKSFRYIFRMTNDNKTNNLIFRGTK